jgi:hypothetical protein
MKLLTKLLKKDFFQMIIVTILVIIIYLLYITTIGNRITRARDLYIQGYQTYENNETEQALKLLEKSNSLWYSRETEELIQEIASSEK